MLTLPTSSNDKNRLAARLKRDHPAIAARVAIGVAIEAELGNRQGQRTDKTEPVQNFAQVEPGQKTREAVAKAAGFGNAETYRQAKTVVAHAEPELIEAMDRGDGAD